MLTTVRGTYKNGQVVLSEDPGVAGEAPVVVTFFETARTVSPRIMSFGMLAIPGRQMSNFEDFEVGEHDESRWDRD